MKSNEKPKTIELLIRPKKKDLGDGFLVARSIPQVQKRMVGPFIFWDHMGPVELNGDREMKVRAHPHIGLSTLTFLLSGEIIHRDSLGNTQAIRPGEVNWMVAGKGITHSERAIAKKEPMKLEGLQIWVALPKETAEIEPDFIHLDQSEIPQFEKEGLNYELLIGNYRDYKSPIPVHSDIFLLHGECSAPARTQVDLKKEQEAAVYILSGELKIEDETFRDQDFICLKTGEQTTLQWTKDSTFMLLGGQKFEEQPKIWWNFVSHSPEKIEEAKKRWSQGKFPKTVDEGEWIPLPQN